MEKEWFDMSKIDMDTTGPIKHTHEITPENKDFFAAVDILKKLTLQELSDLLDLIDSNEKFFQVVKFTLECETTPAAVSRRRNKGESI